MSVPETEIKGPDHSSYPKVVVPSKMTWEILLNGPRVVEHDTHVSARCKAREIQSRAGGNCNVV